jgi:RhoGEF domain
MKLIIKYSGENPQEQAKFNQMMQSEFSSFFLPRRRGSGYKIINRNLARSQQQAEFDKLFAACKANSIPLDSISCEAGEHNSFKPHELFAQQKEKYNIKTKLTVDFRKAGDPKDVFVINEILQTEKAFIEQMRQAKLIMQAAKQKAKPQDLPAIDQALEHLDSLLQASEQANIFSIVDGYQGNTVDLIQKLAEKFTGADYQHYLDKVKCLSYFAETTPLVSSNIGQLDKYVSNKVFVQGNERIFPDLSSYFRAPFQRLTRYEMMFKELKKQTPESNHSLLAKPITVINELNNAYNSQLKSYDIMHKHDSMSSQASTATDLNSEHSDSQSFKASYQKTINPVVERQNNATRPNF